MLDGVRDAVFEPLLEADERQKAEEKMMIARKEAVHGIKVCQWFIFMLGNFFAFLICS